MCIVSPEGATAGLDRAGFNAQVRAQDDLFRAANGQWIEDTPMPADKAEYGVFIQLRDRSDGRVRRLIDGLLACAPESGIKRQIGDYYASYLDEASIEARRLEPLAAWFERIDAVGGKAEWAARVGQLQGIADTPIRVAVEPDPKNPNRQHALTWQSGLGLPDREYYTSGEPGFVKARVAYRSYLETLLRLCGDAGAAAHAEQVFELEARWARAQWPQVDNRDALKTYNPTTLAELASRAPGFDWSVFFQTAALPALRQLSVSQPSYAEAFARIVDETPLATLKLYLRIRLADATADVLPQAFRDARFEFRGRSLRGLEQDQPRWQKAIASLDEALGEGVGQLYVAEHFPPAYKARMQELVANLLAAYDRSISALAWMGAETKARAKTKLAQMTTKIGYPDGWRDYSALVVRGGDAFGNVVRSGRFEYERRAARAGQPVDRGEWGLTPQTVNAYYNPNLNEIVFPAAILDPPFFDMRADDAVNYGAIGAIIGHEISHGFDDQGSRYDGEGRLCDWWCAHDRQAFDALGEKLVEQYGRYEPICGHKLNGRLTLGENLADVSGLQIAFKAYQHSLGRQPSPVIDGLTGEQRFFLGWSQAWRAKTREQRALQLLTVDPHSPAEFRANGAAVNHDGFHSSFGTQPGDGMYWPPEARVRIW